MLTNPALPEGAAALSPDGRILLTFPAAAPKTQGQFCCREVVTGRRLYEGVMADRAFETLAYFPGPRYPLEAAFSPDGKQLVFVTTRLGGHDSRGASPAVTSAPAAAGA